MRSFWAILVGVALFFPSAAQTPPPQPAPQQPAAQTPPPQPVPQQPPRSPWKDKMYFGGGIGASFGDVDYVELAPLVGFRLHPRVNAGVGLLYRWRSDSRYDGGIDTTDYGGNLFAQFGVAGPVFLQAEYEYVSYEYPTSSGSTLRDGQGAALAGAGFSQRISGNAGFYASALYNFSYDSNDLYSAYDSPWVYRVGVTVGF